MDSPTPSLNMAALKDIDFVTEGRLALKDVSFALLHGEISASLPCTKDQVYLNLTTKENAKFCVCLSHRGFQVIIIIIIIITFDTVDPVLGDIPQ